MAEPKCPQCNVEGIEHIVSKDSNERSRGNTAWFNVAYCNECGHIYGVFAKHVIGGGKSSGVQFVLPEKN